MKIFLCILFLAIPCLVQPASLLHKISKKEVSSASDRGANMLATTTEDSTTPESNNTTQKSTQDVETRNITKTENTENKNVSSKADGAKSEDVLSLESRILADQEPATPFHADEFKVKILDLLEPSKPHDAKNAGVSIGLPASHQAPQIVKIPELYIPQYVVLKESDLLNNQQHSIPSITSQFYPFQEIPSLTQDFSSSGSVFGIPGVYPIYPTETLHELGQYPITGVLGEIPVIPDVGEVPQGFEIISLNPPIPISGEEVNHESDSITIDALRKLNKDSKTVGGNNREDIQKNKASDKQNPKIA